MTAPWEKYAASDVGSGPWSRYAISSPEDTQAEKEVSEMGFRPRKPLAYGIPGIGPYLDEAAAAVTAIPNMVTRGAVGPTYDMALARNRAYNRAAEKERPIETAVGQIATGIATGGPIFSRIAPAATMAGRIGQGAAIGAGVGAVEGFGAGEGSPDNRISSAAGGAAVGTALGAAIPVATALGSRAYGLASDYIAPTITRMRFGPDASAEHILANRIAREGSSPAAKRLELQQGQTQAAQLGPNSRAELPEAIADTSDAMQRLTGSVYRSGGEAGNFVKQTLDARQRGPANPYAPQAGEPVGQRARINDATERALQIRSAGSALQTERRIIEQQAQEGATLYPAAFRNQQPYDIQGTLDAFAMQAQQYPAPFQARMHRALNLFRDNSPGRMNPATDLQRFDSAKKALDDMIEGAQRNGQGNLVRELTGFKSNLLEAVHDGGRNQAYATARQAWGSAAENREAIELGRSALREGSEVSAEQFRNLTRGQQVLFRLGLTQSVRNAQAGSTPGTDTTRLFQQQRVQELMNEVIPRSRGNQAVYSNRPERFGDLMQREGRMVQTRNVAYGGSPTQQRSGDDMAFAGDALASMWSRFRSSPSLFNMGVEAVGAGIQKVFGYRQDVAMGLAQRLLETDPAARNQILQRLRSRGGPDRFIRFADQLDRSGQTLIGATTSPLQIEDRR